ncbi:class I SAM-dependent methyltransferase [Rhodoferax koreense]|nr:methyltransferase domain-containing protein [Rhodoferax koreense]
MPATPSAPTAVPSPLAIADAGLGYLTKLETVRGSGADLQMRSLLDRQQYFDPLGEAERAGISSAAWPLFGLLWPSGRMLAHVMQSFDLEGKHILELGCGLGLASLVVHRRGGDITASDNHPLAGEFMRQNLLLNLLPVMKYQTADWSLPSPPLERFDLIIGSDVLYDRGQPEALSQFIERHASPTAEVLIVDPDRGNRASFTRKMGVLGYSHVQTRLTQLPGEGGAYKGRLLSYRRAEQA